MCEKCKQLDGKIQRYRTFITLGLDALTVERINGLVAELRAAKVALHSTTDCESRH
jgi:hypothetical protein